MQRRKASHDTVRGRGDFDGDFINDYANIEDSTPGDVGVVGKLPKRVSTPTLDRKHARNNVPRAETPMKNPKKATKPVLTFGVRRSEASIPKKKNSQ